MTCGWSTMASHPAIQIDRKLQNLAFSNWRLGGSFIEEQHTTHLPHPVHTGPADATDYLHTRATVLHNHLLASQGRLFLFLAKDGGLELNEVDISSGAPQLRPLAGERPPPPGCARRGSIPAPLHSPAAPPAPQL